jgi:two-component system, NtrC family, response regulator AtoC
MAINSSQSQGIYLFPKSRTLARGNSDNAAGISEVEYENTPLIGRSPEMEHIRKWIKRVAGTGLNVLISGESGVGKEVVAFNLYANSPRFQKPFIKVNCAAMPEGLLESELFGYEQGAFTGAMKRKRGKFELSNRGVLMLDEIGDMPLSLQAKLLHVLQSGEVVPLGSEKTLRTDTWTICVTNHDLQEDVKHRRFREDLYYRINAINITVPPLRARKEDIQPLIDYYIQKYEKQLGIDKTLSPAIIEKLVAYDWPGNIRELQNILQRMLVMEDPESVIACLTPNNRPDARCSSDDIPRTNIEKQYVDYLLMTNPVSKTGSAFNLKVLKNRAYYQIDKQIITTVLEKTNWNRTKAAKLLGISYKTLLNKIKELNISEEPELSN